MSGAERRLLPHEELKFVHYVAHVVPFCFSLCILYRLRHAFSLRSITIVRVCMTCLCALLRAKRDELSMRAHRLRVQFVECPKGPGVSRDNEQAEEQTRNSCVAQYECVLRSLKEMISQSGKSCNAIAGLSHIVAVIGQTAAIRFCIVEKS